MHKRSSSHKLIASQTPNLEHAMGPKGCSIFWVACRSCGNFNWSLSRPHRLGAYPHSLVDPERRCMYDSHRYTDCSLTCAHGRFILMLIIFLESMYQISACSSACTRLQRMTNKTIETCGHYYTEESGTSCWLQHSTIVITKWRALVLKATDASTFECEHIIIWTGWHFNFQHIWVQAHLENLVINVIILLVSTMLHLWWVMERVKVLLQEVLACILRVSFPKIHGNENAG